MAWKLDSDRPIYLQLVERIQMEIVSGKYLPGDKLPSVRDLAMTAAVNPNTMQRALTELERIELIITQRTSGRMVTDNSERIQGIRRELAKEHLGVYFGKMKELGYTKQEILDLIMQNYEGENETWTI